MVRLTLLFLIFNISLLAQPFIQLAQPTTISMQSKTVGAQEQSETDGSDSVYLFTTGGYMPIRIDSLKDDDGNLAIIYDSLAVYGDSLRLLFDYERDVVGSFIKYFYAYHTGYGSPDTSIVTYEVVYSGELMAESPIEFGTVYANDVESVYLYNSTAQSISITSFSGIEEPFSLFEAKPISSVSAGAYEYYNIYFQPTTADTYTDTLVIESVYASTTYYDSVIISGTYVAETPLLAAPTSLTITDSTDVIALQWDANSETNISYYNIERSTDDITYTSLANTIDTTYTDYIIDSTRYYYKVKAINTLAESSAWSDTVNAMMLIDGGSFYFVSEDGSGSGVGSAADPFLTIAEVNATSLAKGDVVRFKSGDQFSDATLACADSVKYNTYGGTTRAIIGDSTTGSDITITAYNDDVTIDNLKIFGYNTATRVVRVDGDGLTISNCVITGGESWKTSKPLLITYLSTPNIGYETKIIHNEIYNGYKGIYMEDPYNVEIAYNEMYNFYRLDGYQSVGGTAITSHTTDYYPVEADYTYHIHHNDIYNFEHSAMYVGTVSRALIEYNYIHDNLDERIYRGGVTNGVFSKLTDNQGMFGSSLGSVVRYNVVYNVRKYGERGYTYDNQTTAMTLAGTYSGSYTGTQADPIYVNSANSSHTSDLTSPSGNILGGGGYGNQWVHNNLFYNTNEVIISRGYNYVTETGLGVLSWETGATVNTFDNQLGAYFVNNTIYNAGDDNDLNWLSDDYGIIYREDNSRSPFTVVNNIVDFRNTYARTAIGLKDDSNYVDYNLHTLRSGIVESLPSNNSTTAVYLKESGNQADGAGEVTGDPNWTDTTATFFLASVGINGVNIPDVRLESGGNAHGAGLDYDSLGDNYLDDYSTHVLGEDPTGREFDYDILGKKRETNDIGAFGTGIGATPTGASSYTVEYKISAINDDVHFYASGTNRTNDYLFIGNVGGTSTSTGLKFNSVTIPVGATIDSAVVYVTAKGTLSDTDCNITIAGEDTLSPSDFTETIRPTTTRVLNVTTATVDTTYGTWTIDTEYEAIVTSIVSELNTSYDYSSGSGMVFWLKDNSSTTGAYRSIKSYDFTGAATGRARLKIWYTE